MHRVIEHKCDNCGASLVFNPDTQTMLCPYCGDLSSVYKTAKDDARPRSKKRSKNWSAEELQYISEYQCESCGGDIFTDQTTSATLCPYCGNAVMLRGRLSGSLRPQEVIPFQISKERALEGLEEYIGEKRFVHKDFLDKRKLEEVKGVYVPFWIYDATMEGNMTFKCVNERVWTEGKYEYTQRKYYRVSRSGEMDFNYLPVVASTKVSDEIMESLEPFNHLKSKSFITGYLSGYVADKYDIEEEDAYPRAFQRMTESLESELCSTVDYDEVSIHMSDTYATSCSCSYSLYPVWLMSSVWNDKVFTFAMNGQTGKMVGNLPLYWSKLLAISLLFVLMAAALFTFIGYLFSPKYVALFALMGLLFGSSFAIAFYLWFSNKLKTLHHENNANRYSNVFSFHLIDEDDEFLYDEVTRKRIDDDDDDD